MELWRKVLFVFIVKLSLFTLCECVMGEVIITLFACGEWRVRV